MRSMLALMHWGAMIAGLLLMGWLLSVPIVDARFGPSVVVVGLPVPVLVAVLAALWLVMRVPPAIWWRDLVRPSSSRLRGK